MRYLIACAVLGYPLCLAIGFVWGASTINRIHDDARRERIRQIIDDYLRP